MIKENKQQAVHGTHYINAHASEEQSRTGTSNQVVDPQANTSGDSTQAQSASGGVFQFPFQRRARSLSIPKQEAGISVKLNKPGPAPGIGTENPAAAPIVQGAIL